MASPHFDPRLPLPEWLLPLFAGLGIAAGLSIIAISATLFLGAERRLLPAALTFLLGLAAVFAGVKYLVTVFKRNRYTE